MRTVKIIVWFTKEWKRVYYLMTIDDRVYHNNGNLLRCLKLKRRRHDERVNWCFKRAHIQQTEHSKRWRDDDATTCFDVKQRHNNKNNKQKNANLQINRQKLAILRELNMRHDLHAHSLSPALPTMHGVSSYILSCRCWFSYAGCYYIYCMYEFIIIGPLRAAAWLCRDGKTTRQHSMHNDDAGKQWSSAFIWMKRTNYSNLWKHWFICSGSAGIFDFAFLISFWRNSCSHKNERPKIAYAVSIWAPIVAQKDCNFPANFIQFLASWTLSWT